MWNRLFLAGVFACGSVIFGAQAQEEHRPTPQPGQVEQLEDAEDSDVVHGRIKEVEDQRKIVIAVDGRPDKSFDLNSPKTRVRVADGLAIGDAVRVIESRKHENHLVQIVRDVNAGEGEGERTRRNENDRQQERNPNK